MNRFVLYFRVSTDRQGQSGLGLDAQRASALSVAKDGEIVGEFTEIESGKRSDRAKLAEAIKLCRKTKATLVIAKLDRLARNVHFISGLMESKIEFIACDLPMANKLTIHIMAAMAEHEADMISQRTKAALGALKARGVKLGNPDAAKAAVRAREANSAAASQRAANVLPIIESIKASGLTTLVQIAGALNNRGIKTARGGEWHATSIQRVLARV